MVYYVDETKLVDTVVTASKRKRMSLRDELVLPSSKKFVLDLFPKGLDSSETLDKHQQSLDQLEYAVKVEKKQSSTFEEYLKKALLNTDSEPLKTLPDVNITNRSVDENQRYRFAAHHLLANDCDASLSKEHSSSNSENQLPYSSPYSLSSLSLAERVRRLNLSLHSEKSASRLLEKRLQKSLLPDLNGSSVQ